MLIQEMTIIAPKFCLFVHNKNVALWELLPNFLAEAAWKGS